MAIKDWHPGQLLIFWIALFLVWFVVGGLISVGFDWLYRLGFHDFTNVHKAIWTILVSLASLVLGLTVSWKWFDGRKK